MSCPSCRSDDIVTVETECPNPEEPGEFMAFSVCRNCDYGINEHTEGECNCKEKQRTTVEIDPDDPTKLRVVIKGLSCSVFSILSQDEARVLAAYLVLRLEEMEPLI